MSTTYKGQRAELLLQMGKAHCLHYSFSRGPADPGVMNRPLGAGKSLQCIAWIIYLLSIVDGEIVAKANGGIHDLDILKLTARVSSPATP